MRKKESLTLLPFMLAIVVGLAGMGTNVYDIHARQIGALDVGHRSTRVSDLAPADQPTVLTRFLERMRFMATAEDGFIAADLLVPAEGLNACVQRKADIVEAIKARKATLADTKLTAEARAEVNGEIDQLVTLAEANAAALAREEKIAQTLRDVPAAAQPTDPARDANGNLRLVTGDDAVDKMAKAPGFFGRQLIAVKNFAVSGGRVDATDQRILAPMMGAATGLNSDVGAEGGFLVAQERATTVIQRAYQTGEVLKRVKRLPIGPGSNGMSLPAIDETSRADNSRYGGIVSGWLGQGNSLSAGKPKFRLMDMKLRKVGAFVYSTGEMLVDAIALEGWINENLPKELRFRTEDAVFNGTGANQPQGVLNSGAVVTVSRNTAGRVLFEDMKAMWKRLHAPLRSTAVWFVDQDVESEFDDMAVAIGTSGVLDPSYKPAGSVPGQPFATYKGAPIIPVEYCAALGTTGDIVLASLSDYTVIDKGDVEQAVSLHVAFLTDEGVYRFIYRVDGQNDWNAPLTPKSGGATKSNVVVLG